MKTIIIGIIICLLMLSMISSVFALTNPYKEANGHHVFKSTRNCETLTLYENTWKHRVVLSMKNYRISKLNPREYCGIIYE